MPTTRRFSPGVTRAVQARVPTVERKFERMFPGDEFQVATTGGWFRFVNAKIGSGGHVDHVTGFGPLIGKPGNNSGRPKAPALRCFFPDAVKVPSQRALNLQRRRRAADG